MAINFWLNYPMRMNYLRANKKYKKTSFNKHIIEFLCVSICISFCLFVLFILLLRCCNYYAEIIWASGDSMPVSSWSSHQKNFNDFETITVGFWLIKWVKKKSSIINKNSKLKLRIKNFDFQSFLLNIDF